MLAEGSQRHFGGFKSLGFDNLASSHGGLDARDASTRHSRRRDTYESENHSCSSGYYRGQDLDLHVQPPKPANTTAGRNAPSTTNL